MKKIFYIINLLILLIISSNVHAVSFGDWINPRVEITDFVVPDSIEVGKEFTLTVTIENHKIFEIKTSIQVNLLDGMLNNIKKDITIDKVTKTIEPKDSTKININCIIREDDSDWYKDKYNLEIVVYKNYLRLGGRIQLDNSIQGITLITSQTILNEKLIEKEKIRIIDVDVPDNIKIADNNTFNTIVYVKNESYIDFDNWSAWVRVDFIDKPSAIPDLEEYIDLKSLGTFKSIKSVSCGLLYTIAPPHFGSLKTIYFSPDYEVIEIMFIIF